VAFFLCLSGGGHGTPASRGQTDVNKLSSFGLVLRLALLTLRRVIAQ
jgi:hypothetical protein